MSLILKAQRFVFPILFSVFFIGTSVPVFAQVTVGFQGGEPGNTWGYTSTGANSLAITEATQSPNKIAGTTSIVVGGNTGGGNCFATGSGNGPDVERTFTFNALDISGTNQSTRTLTFNWGNRYPACSGTGWDAGENLVFQAYHDNMGQGEITIANGNNNAQFSIATHSYTHTIPPCVNSFYFVIYVTTNRADELLFLDEVKITAPQLNAPLSQPSAISGSSVLCPGLTSTYSVVNVPGLNYTWSGLPAGASFATPNGTSTIDVNWGTTPPGDYTLIVTPSDACGNDGPPQQLSIQLIQVGTPPTISGPTEICDGDVVTLTSSVANDIVWDNTGETTQSIDITEPGTYTLTFQNDCGTQTVSHTVVAGALPSVTSADLTPVTCNGSADGAVTVHSPEANLEYSLDGGDFQTSNTFTGLAAGQHVIVIQIVGGCSMAYPFVIGEPAPLAVQAGITSNGCDGQPAQLNSSVNLTGTTTYQWTGPNGYSSAVQNPADITENGTYIIFVTVNGCTASSSIEVTIGVPPVVQFTSTAVCEGEETEFSSAGSSATSPDVIAEWNWNFGDGNTANMANPVHEYSGSGSFIATLEVITASGCSAQLQSDVYVAPKPVANFSFSPSEISAADPQVNFVNTSIGGGTYTWSFGDNSAGSTDFSPTHTYSNEPADYVVTLSVTNAFGCTDEVSKPLQVTSGLTYYVPNTFTPNEDEFNTVFLPIMTEGFDLANFEMNIYNRWGEVVFSSRDVLSGWNGTYDGLMADEGTYIWDIRVKRLNDDRYEAYHGHVTLMR